MTSIQTLPRPGDVIAGKYRIDHELGTGGMGAVYQVTHRVTGKRFALKWLLPQVSGHSDAAKRFIREAQVAGRFEHPNVVEVYDVGAEADSFYMVMELLEGESLASRVERAGPLSVADTCRLLIPCMHGVAEAHAAGIIHRDLKPANIFVCGATRQTPEYAKVLDFGISKVSDAPDDAMHMTRSGTLIGTPHYMPLEQMRGRPVDHRADIYAFGVVLYQVLSGKLPFPAHSFSDLVLMIAHETPKPLEQVVPRLPAGLSDVVARAMAREAADRHPNLGELIEELEQFASAAVARVSTSVRPPMASLSLPTPLSTESQARLRPSQPVRESSAGLWIAGGIAALALALAAGAIWWKRAELLPALARDADLLRSEERTPAATGQPDRPEPPGAARANPDEAAARAVTTTTDPAAATTADSNDQNTNSPLAADLPASPQQVQELEPVQIGLTPTAAGGVEPEPQRATPDRSPESLPPVPRSNALRPKAVPPVVRVEPEARPPEPEPRVEPESEPEPDEVQPKPRKGRVPAITEDDFY